MTDADDRAMRRRAMARATGASVALGLFPGLVFDAMRLMRGRKNRPDDFP